MQNENKGNIKGYKLHEQDFSKTGQFNVFERGGFACRSTSMLPNRVLLFTEEFVNQNLKKANEFALQLNVHTNTLNKALKESTGRTTTEWIAERMIKEAKALLQFSSWDMAEIAYSLGFEHASNFNIFFKKQADITPL